VAERIIGLTTVAGTLAPPNETKAPGEKFIPVTVTAVPPAIGPERGARAETLGADELGGLDTVSGIVP
jgi:hypothetical protein